MKTNEEGKDSAFYETSQDRNSTNHTAYSGTIPANTSIRKLLHDNALLEHQNKLLQDRLNLTKQNCTLKQLNLIATIVSWFEDEGRIDVENTQTPAFQDSEQREQQTRIQEQRKGTIENVQQDYTKSEVSGIKAEIFNQPENIRAVISGSKVVADLRHNVTTLGNILKGLEDTTRREHQISDDQHITIASSVGVKQLQQDHEGHKTVINSELSKTQKEKILQLIDSTKQTMLKTIDNDNNTHELSNKNKTSQERRTEIQPFESSMTPTYKNTNSSFRKSVSADSEKAIETCRSNQTTKATANEETVLAGSETTKKNQDVTFKKRSFLSTKLSDDDVVSAKKYAEIPILSSTVKDDSVFVFDQAKQLLSSTLRDDRDFAFNKEKPILSSTARDDGVFVFGEKPGNSTTPSRNAPVTRQFHDRDDETIVSGNLIKGECLGTAVNRDVIIQKDVEVPLLSSTANKEEIEKSLGTCEVDDKNELRDLNYETLISGNMLGIENQEMFLNSDMSDDVFTLDKTSNPKLSSTAKSAKELRKADTNVNQGKETGNQDSARLNDTNGDVFLLNKSPPLFSSTLVTNGVKQQQYSTKVQLLYTERADNNTTFYSTAETGNGQKGKTIPNTKLIEPKKNLAVDPLKDRSNKAGSFKNFIASIQTNTSRPDPSSVDQSKNLTVDQGDIPFSKYSQIDNKHVSKLRKGAFGHLFDHDRLQSEGFEVRMNSPGMSLQDNVNPQIRQFNNSTNVANTSSMSRNTRVEKIQKTKPEENANDSQNTKPVKKSRQPLPAEDKILMPITDIAKNNEIRKQGLEGAKEATSFNQPVAVTKESFGNKFDETYQENTISRQYNDTIDEGNIMGNNSPDYFPNNKRIEKINKSVTFSKAGTRMDKVSNTFEHEKRFGDWSNDLNHLNSSLCRLETLLDELDQEGSYQQISLHRRRQHAIRRFRVWKGLRSQKAGLDGSLSGSIFDSSEVLLTAESFGRSLSVDSKEHTIDLHDGFRNKTDQLKKYKNVKKIEKKTNGTDTSTPHFKVSEFHRPRSQFPDETLFGELSFQLERRVLAYVFNGHSQMLLHGFNLKNIELMIRTQGGQQRDSLRRRYEQITDVFRGYGWKPRVHAQFVYAMIHTYGTYQDISKIRHLAKENGWDNFSVLRHHVLSIIPGVHRCNMIVILDCLMNLVTNDSKIIFLW